MKQDEICLFFWEGRAAPPQTIAASLHAAIHIPCVTCMAPGMAANSSGPITVAPTDNAVSRARYSQGSPFQALGVIAWGHIARMAALKHVNQEGKLLNLCAGVRKMLLKKHAFAFSVMSGARKCGARILRTNQREGVESSAAWPPLRPRLKRPSERETLRPIRTQGHGKVSFSEEGVQMDRN